MRGGIVAFVGFGAGVVGMIWASISVEAFVGNVNAAGQHRRWALNPPDGRVPASSVNASARSIVYRLDAGGWSTTNRTAELMSIRAAFDQWQAVSGTVLKFQEGATVSGTKDINSLDNTNTLFWTTQLFVNGGRDSLSGAMALTYLAALVDGNVITDADTVFNGGQFRWFTDYRDPTQQAVFVEAIALHEIGHFVGLHHSPYGGATMLAVGDLGVNSQVGLASDDILGARFLYGTTATLAGLGKVSGTVTAGGQPVLGAAVFAEDAGGNLVAGTVTVTNGTYLIPALPAGAYTVRATPLDPQATGNYLVRGTDIAPAYRNANVNFLPSADKVTAVVAGGTAKVDFAVTAGSPARIVRMLRPTADLAGPAFNNKPVSVQPAGQTVYLGVLTQNAVTGAERLRITGDGLTVVGPVVVRPQVLGDASLVAVPVLVSPTATPGHRSARLEWDGVFAWAHGFLEILPPHPDVNFDGLDDRFQRTYWPRFTVPEAGPAMDPDGDGFTNQREFVAGSNPTNRLSANFVVRSVRVTAGGAKVRSEAAKGKKFQLYTRDAVPGSDWRTVGGAVTAATDELEFSDPGATNAVRFYRVQLQP